MLEAPAHIASPAGEEATEEARRLPALAAPPVAASAPPGRHLEVDGRRFELRGVTTRIGRSPAADVMLDDPSVSRRHALITCRGALAFVLDDRSLNGTRLNGERVRE